MLVGGSSEPAQFTPRRYVRTKLLLGALTAKTSAPRSQKITQTKQRHTAIQTPTHKIYAQLTPAFPRTHHAHRTPHAECRQQQCAVSVTCSPLSTSPPLLASPEASLCSSLPSFGRCRRCCPSLGVLLVVTAVAVVRSLPSFVVRRSSFVVRRSSFVVRRSSFVVRRSSFVVQ